MLERLGYGTQGRKKPGATSPYLDGVLGSVTCDMDATLTASYPGSSQSWANMIAAPADGSAQADWDVWLGTDGSDESATSPVRDPSFSGTPGTQAAYFYNNAEGNCFKFKNQSGPTSLLKAHRKTSGGPWWCAIVHYMNTLGVDTFLGGVNTTGKRGLTIYMNTGGAMQIWDGSSQVAPSVPAYTTGSYHLTIVSCNPTVASNNLRVWLNSRSAVTNTWVPVGDAVASSVFYLGAAEGNSGSISSLTNYLYRIKHFSFGNELLDDTKASLLIDHLNARHGTTYA